MVVDGTCHTVESRSQVNNPGDRSKKDDSSAGDFSPLLFLILSVPTQPNNVAIADKGRPAGLNQAAPVAVSQSSGESMQSNGAAIGGGIGVQAENQRSAPNADVAVVTNAPPGYVSAVSDEPSTPEIEPDLNGGASAMLQSATSRAEISPSRAAGESPAMTSGVVNHEGPLSDKTLEADPNAKSSDRLGAIFQPVINGIEEPGPAQKSHPNILLEQTPASSEAPQAGTPEMAPSKTVGTPNGGSQPTITKLGVDQKNLLIALDAGVGKAAKEPGAVVEAVGEKPETQPSKVDDRSPGVAKDVPDDGGADGATQHLQNTLDPKVGPQLDSGNSVSAKTSNGQFNASSGDKAPHEAPEMSRGGAPSPNQAVMFMARPTVLHEAASAAADVPANAWRPVVERVAEEIAGRVKFNKHDAIIQLDPPELGKIRIDLHVDGDKLQARIFTQGHESQSLIENHLQELRQTLQANNLDLVEVHVRGGWHGASGDAMQGFQQQQQQQTGSQQKWAWVSGNITGGDAVEALPGKPLTTDRGRVSMWA